MRLLALAQAAIGDLESIARSVWDAVTNGNYRLAAALGVILIVHLLRTYGVKFWAALASGKIAFVMALVVGVAGSFATAMTAGTMSWELPVIGLVLLEGLTNGLVAAGVVRGKQMLAKPKEELPDDGDKTPVEKPPIP